MSDAIKGNPYLSLSQTQKNHQLLIHSNKGNASEVNLLLQAGANPNTANLRGETPLIEAAYLGYTEIAKILLKSKKVDLEEIDLVQYTALHCAVTANHLDIVALLIQAGANFETKTILGITPLGSASIQNYTAVIYLLMSHMSENQINTIFRYQDSIQTHYENYKKVIATRHKVLSVLCSNLNEKNPFLYLPIELRGLIFLKYYLTLDDALLHAQQAQFRAKQNFTEELNNLSDQLGALTIQETVYLPTLNNHMNRNSGLVTDKKEETNTFKTFHQYK